MRRKGSGGGESKQIGRRGDDNDESCVSMGAVAGEEKYCKGEGSAGE